MVETFKRREKEVGGGVGGWVGRRKDLWDLELIRFMKWFGGSRKVFWGFL